MRASILWALAQAELRTCRRLLRTWLLFFAVVVLATHLSALQLIHHAGLSSFSPSVGTSSFRFLFGFPTTLEGRSLSECLILLFQIGIIFLVCEIRNRDVSDRIYGSIDAKPITNFELISARFSANVFLLMIVSVIVFALQTAGSHFSGFFDVPYDTSFAPVGVLSFLVMDLFPNLVIWGALTICLAILIRFRLVVVFVMIGLAIVQFLLLPLLPAYLLEAIAQTTAMVIPPSDVAPEFTNTTIVLQRLALIAVAVGLLLLSCVLYPRVDRTSSTVKLASGFVCLLIGVGVQAGSIFDAIHQINETERLAAVHKSAQAIPPADILHLSGDVRLNPGSEFDVRYRIKFRPPAIANEELIFSFNPGFELLSLTLDNEHIPYRFEDGLIRIADLGMDSNDNRELYLTASGKPDMKFGYFDSRLDLNPERAVDGWELRKLGFRYGMNTSQYIALMPALKWYPTAGSAYGEDLLATRPKDHFTVDLEVEAPRGWIVAGPGARETVTSQSKAKFLFQPNTTVPEIALIGSQFVRMVTSIAGVEFELLMKPQHMHNVELFSVALPVLKERIGEMLTRARDYGIAYPYKLFSVVEVPTALRIYGGGWRMDSVQSLPGILLLRETGFPTASFDRAIQRQSQRYEGQRFEEAVYRLLKIYFVNDFNGGNPFLGATRNLMKFQTSSTGKGATAVDNLIDVLATRIVTEEDGYFSIYHAGAVFGPQPLAVKALISGRVFEGSVDFVSYLRDYFVNRSVVWDVMISTPLVELDFDDAPMRSLDVLDLKIGAIAESLIDAVGTQRLGRLLSAIRERHAGSNFDYADLEHIASELEIDLNALLGNWVEGVELPGFRVIETSAVRLPDDAQGEPVYQTTLDLTNGEPAPGLIAISYEERSELPFDLVRDIEPLLISGKSRSKITFHTESSISWIILRPYLSLNRKSFEIHVSEPASTEPELIERLPHFTSSDWQTTHDGSIVVDDLDEGFKVIGNELRMRTFSEGITRATLSFNGAFINRGLDAGLPSYQDPGPYLLFWVRSTEPQAWGKYRRSTTIGRGGTGKTMANFSAHLPSDGYWSLDYHFPLGMRRASKRAIRSGVSLVYLRAPRFFRSTVGRGNYELTVKNGERSIPIRFNVAEASHGWNRVGEFMLEKGKVDVTVSDVAEMEVYADAIRWTPLNTKRRVP